MNFANYTSRKRKVTKCQSTNALKWQEYHISIKITITSIYISRNERAVYAYDRGAENSHYSHLIGNYIYSSQHSKQWWHRNYLKKTYILQITWCKRKREKCKQQKHKLSNFFPTVITHNNHQKHIQKKNPRCRVAFTTSKKLSINPID